MRSALGRNKAILVFAAIAFLFFSLPLVAKRWLTGQLINLTKESGGEIPYGQSAITALVIGPDGKVYGGTSADRPGKEAYLFRYKEGNDVEVLGKLSPAIPGQQKIWHALVAGADGKLYGGTWTDAKEGGKQPAGHLFRYDIQAGKAVDLGIVSEGEGVFTLTSNDEKTIVYGITTPSCLLFSCDISKGKIRIIGDVMASIKTYLNPPPTTKDGKLVVTDVGEEKGRGWERSIGGSAWKKRYFPPRAIICDNQGNVWGSRDQGYFFKYDLKQDKILDSQVQMPLAIGTEDAVITEISIDSLVKDKEGVIYGGTYSDGYVFKMNPVTGDVINLGKPIREQRIRSLTMGPDGMLYGIGGEDDFVSKLFRYNPKTGDMRELGVIHERGWTVYRIDTLIAGSDGALYLGESARISHLIRIKDFRYISVIGA
jgi:hypothetical protein